MISHKHKTLFIHVPKTAGKSVLSLFGLPMLGRDYSWDLTYIQWPYGHETVRKFTHEPWFPEYFKFGFVRHPFDRLVSAFFFLSRGGLNEIDRRFAQEFVMPFEEDFGAFVIEGLPKVISHTHFRQQSFWLCNKAGRPLVDFVGKFENLDQDIATVARRLSLDYGKLPHLNTSRRKVWPTYFDKRVREGALRFYENDFTIFNYPLNSHSDKKN